MEVSTPFTQPKCMHMMSCLNLSCLSPFFGHFFRPHFLVLVPDRETEKPLIFLSRYFNKGHGMMVAATVIVGETKTTTNNSPQPNNSMLMILMLLYLCDGVCV